MKTRSIFVASMLSLLPVGYMAAQTARLQPTPQKIVSANDSIPVPASYRLTLPESLEQSPTAQLLKSILPNATTQQADFQIIIGIKGDKAIKKYNKLIPEKAEGYYLSIGKTQIVLAGADERGTFYGMQTLAQLMARNTLPLADITDYPDVPYRGVVEGFYGTPWSHEARLRQLDFYGQNKMNVYLYGPKDDPYHSTPNWRKPYPDKEAAQIKELVARAKANNVIFYWAIHPGQDIKWNEEDRNLLIQKFENMYQLGVRGFAVFFDDIVGEGTKAEKQVELLNYIDDKFIRTKKDVAPLVMCPTEYNKAWSNVKGGYLTTLGEKLNKDIKIMWTGDRVIACIDKPTMDFINPLLQRKAYIWWNFPVSDYVRDHLLMGPVYGNGLDTKDDMSAFVSNPMEHPEASKIALYSIADYAWNPDQYNSEEAWRQAVRNLLPQHAAYLQTFVEHNSDLGPNGHGFRRDESVALTPALQALTQTYADGYADQTAWTQVETECQKIIEAADVLLVCNENPMLIQEMKPWLIQFKLLGEYGQEVLHMLPLASSDKPADRAKFIRKYDHIKALRQQMYQVNITYNQNSYQPGVATGSKHLLPAFNQLFETATTRYNQTNGTSLDTKAEYAPYVLESNVPQLARQPIQLRGRVATVSPSNESILWKPDGAVTIIAEEPCRFENIRIDLGTAESASAFQLEVSPDGTNWEKAAWSVLGGSTTLQAHPSISEKAVKEIRIRNISGKEQQSFFKQFRLVKLQEQK